MTTLGPDALIHALTDIFGARMVSTDPEVLLSHGKDASRAYQPAPLAVVFPSNAEQLQALVLLANAHQLGLVASGGRTGLSGGAVALNGEVVVSFAAMNQIDPVNTIDQTIRVQAGAITHWVQQAAKDAGLYYPLDFASSGSSQIGGNIATNAGGIKVIRYGMTRDWVMGLTVVTGTGSLLRLNKDLTKNNTGYDFRHLFIGSEGTLGFIVDATLRLTALPQPLTAVVIGAASMNAIMDILARCKRDLSLTAFEFFSESGLELVCAAGQSRPFDTRAPYYVLLEYEQDASADDHMMAAFEDCLSEGHALDGVISQNQTQHSRLWALRENLSSTCAQYSPYKNDLSVRVSSVPEFLSDIEQLIYQSYPDFTIVWWGHIGDGNLHLNILKPDNLSADAFYRACEAVNQDVFALVERYQGSVSAEHGVGLLKKRYLHHSRSAEEIDLMRNVKAVFDPRGIMNPGKLLP